MLYPDALCTADVLTLEDVTRVLAGRLQALDPEIDAWREARLLVEAASGLTSLALLRDGQKPICALSDDVRARLETFAMRRLQGEPLSRIRGVRGFWKSDFHLSPDTLDPRPETEGLIELACQFFEEKDPPLRILDAGTGTGCLLISLLQEFPQALGVGIDCSPQALCVAEENAIALDVSDRCTFHQGHWLEGISDTFDLIVSNPPYIPSGTIAHLDPGVRLFDPHLALDGGPDGLDAFRTLIPQAAAKLSPEGVLLLECGIYQDQGLERLLAASFPCVSFWEDLAGIKRYAKASFCR